MLRLFIIFFIVTSLNGLNGLTRSNTLETVLSDNGYSFKMKTVNGWLRVFNNQEKLKEHGFDKYNKVVINSCIKELTEINRNKNRGDLK